MLFKKNGKRSVRSFVRTDQDRRTYLINGEWVHVPNCVDNTPRAEADESENNPKRKKYDYGWKRNFLWRNILFRLS